MQMPCWTFALANLAFAIDSAAAVVDPNAAGRTGQYRHAELMRRDRDHEKHHEASPQKAFPSSSFSQAIIGRSTRGTHSSSHTPPPQNEKLVACHVAMHKLMVIVDHALTKKASMGDPILDDDLQAFASLKMRELSDVTLAKSFDALSRVDLNSALQTGYVWTDDDQESLLDACYNKDMSDKLEEPSPPASGEDLMQGDLVLRASGSSLLELGPERAESSPIRLWKDGMVKYCFAADLSESAKRVFKAAVAHTKSQVGCLTFREVASSSKSNTSVMSCEEQPSILVQSASAGCWGDIGMVSTNGIASSQTLNLGRGCETLGYAAHQLGHALGLVHQHVRKDREKWLKISEKNTNMLHWPLYEESYPADYFDYFSLMLVGSRAFSTDGSPTVETLSHKLLERFIGQRMGFSEDDVRKLGQLYSCSETEIRPIATTSNLNLRVTHHQALVTDGSCEDQRDPNSLSVTSRGLLALPCARMEPLCQHPAEARRLATSCPRTCLVCLQVSLVDRTEEQVLAHMAHNLYSSWADSFANYTSMFSMRGATVATCMDSTDTRITFRGGAYASCQELTHYCDLSARSDTQQRAMGDLVRKTCPLTCGLCPLEKRKDDAAPCEDLPDENMTVKLRFPNGTNKAAECSELIGFCTGGAPAHEITVMQVQRKCRKTCDLCSQAHSGRPKFEPVPEWDDPAFKCSRRRRQGFCHERRRRG